MPSAELDSLPKIKMKPVTHVAKNGRDAKGVAPEDCRTKDNEDGLENRPAKKENGTYSVKLILPSDNQESLLEKISELRESLDALRLEARGKREEVDSLKLHISECHSKDVLQCRRIAELEDDLSLTKAEDQMELETLRGVALTTLNDSIADYTVALADVRGELAATKISLKEAQNSHTQLQEAHRLERERLILESSELRLLYQSRGRQISELQDEIQNMKEKETQSVADYRGQIEQMSKDARFWKEKFMNLERQVYERGDELDKMKEAKDKAEREYDYAMDARAKAEAREKEIVIHNEVLKGRLDDIESQLGVERDFQYTSDSEQLRREFEEEKARLQQCLEEEISKREEMEKALEEKSQSAPSLRIENSSDGQSLATPAQTELRLRFHDSDWSASSSDSSRNEIGAQMKDSLEIAKRDWEAALSCQDDEDSFGNDADMAQTTKALNLDALRENDHTRELLESTKDQLHHVQSLNKKLVIRCQELEKDCVRERNYLQAERKKLFATLESQIKKENRIETDEKQEIAKVKAQALREKNEIQVKIQDLEAVNESLQSELESVKREYAECKLEYEIESVTIGLEKQQDNSRQREELEKEFQKLDEREAQLVEWEKSLQAHTADLQSRCEIELLQIQKCRQRVERAEMENAEYETRLFSDMQKAKAFGQSLDRREKTLNKLEGDLVKREEKIRVQEELLQSQQTIVSGLNEEYQYKLSEANLRIEQNEKIRKDIENAKRVLIQQESDIACRVSLQDKAYQKARRGMEVKAMQLEDERCASIRHSAAVILEGQNAKGEIALLKSKLGSWVKEYNSQSDEVRTYKQEISELKRMVEIGSQDRALINELEEGLKASQKRERELENQIKVLLDKRSNDGGGSATQAITPQRYDMSQNSRTLLGSDSSPLRREALEHEALESILGEKQASRQMHSPVGVQSLDNEKAQISRRTEDSPYALRRSWPQSPQSQQRNDQEKPKHAAFQQSPIQTFTFSRVQQQHSPSSFSSRKQQISNVVNHMEDDVCRLTLTTCSGQRSFPSSSTTHRSTNRLSTEAQRREDSQSSMLALSMSSDARSTPRASSTGLNRSFDNHLLRQVSLLEFADQPPGPHEESDFLALRVSELQRERSRLQQELARKQAIAAAETEASLLMARRETLLDRFAQQVGN